MLRRALSRPLLGLLSVALLGVLAATPAQAYGAANWQIAFAGTGTSSLEASRPATTGIVNSRSTSTRPQAADLLARRASISHLGTRPVAPL